MKIAAKTAKKILVILLIVFGTLSVLGGVVFSIGMAAAGWDFSAMNTVDYVYKEYTERHKITSISLDFATNDIKVHFDEKTTQVRVEYAEKYTKQGEQLTQTTITEEGGVLKMKQEQKFTLYVDFSFGENSTVSVYLPKNYAYTLDIETDTGDVFLDGNATLKSLKVETDTGTIQLGGAIRCEGKIDLSVETGSVLLNEFSADSLFIESDTGNVCLDGKSSVNTSVEIETDTGDVSILHTLTANDVKIETDTGDVNLNNLSGATLTVNTDTGNIKSIGTSLLDFTTLLFSTDTGDITLHLVGTIDDYSVQAHTNTGSNNLYDYPTANKERTLKIHSITGNIKVIFQPKDTAK